MSTAAVAVNQSQSRDSSLLDNLKYLMLLGSGYLVYQYLGFGTKVDAATPVKNRRSQHNFIADVVEESAPSVVYIEIKDATRKEFFTGQSITISNGSGFIIAEDGLILTNAHVVASKPNTNVIVKLLNGNIYQGAIESVDMHSDLATVRINANNLPAMKLGNSSDLRPGEFVVAIGSPLALSNTVTSGVISSTHRGSDELGMRGKDMVYIQTDAAINFGNSGGPLVNLDGEAIGVNSMKVTSGISFAIPIDYVKAFLLQSSSVKKQVLPAAKRYMGITMLTLTPQIVNEMRQRDQYFPATIKEGVLVWKVIYGSPADVGGLKPGDIVVSINKKAITKANDVYDILESRDNYKLLMTIIRSGVYQELVIVPQDT